jgi:hypothetical protein
VPWQDPAAKPLATTPIRIAHEGFVRQETAWERTAKAAYFRWLSRGGRHGDDINDWLEAERGLTFRQP